MQDTHHSLIRGNFGSSFPFWDWLCGTHIDVNTAVKLGLRSKQE